MSNVTFSGQQVAIFNWFETGRGNAATIARAGTGKTFTITNGITKAPEQKICYVVFNKKNRKEAEEKIKDRRVEIKTLHALGFAFIRNVWRGIGCDDSGQDTESDRIDAASPGIPGGAATCVKRLVSWAKNTTVAMPTHAQLLDMIGDKGFEPDDQSIAEGWTAGRVADVALAVLKASLTRSTAGRISFDDMVWLPVVCGFARPWFELVVVDEAQDMTAPQLAMARKACKPRGRIMLVGDPRQCIYGFRGAKLDGMEQMAKDLNAAIFPLTTTYRCPKAVVALAATMVPDYAAAPEAPEGYVGAISESALVGSVKIGDAILSRKNAPLMPTCLALLRAGIPARIEGRDIGKALIAIAQKLKARSVPEFLKKLQAWGERQAKRASASKNAEERLAAIDDQVATLAAVAEGAGSVGEIEARLSDLFQDSDAPGARPAVVLSSIHKAKGLEWNRTFVLRATFRSWVGDADVSEESNIAYVAITRSKSEMVVVGQPPAGRIGPKSMYQQIADGDNMAAGFEEQN